MRTILVIDDSSLTIGMVKKALHDLNVNIVTANNGSDGIASYRTHRPDLVICDLHMPEMDGFGVLKELSAIDSNHCTIILSADVQNTTNVQAMELGARKFICKPINKENFAATISKFLSQRSTGVSQC